MNQNFWIVIGMSIAYLASFMGLIFAWIHYRKRKAGKSPTSDERR